MRWFLSTGTNDLPASAEGKKPTYHSATYDGVKVEFSEGFTNLHALGYESILAGGGFEIEGVRHCVKTAETTRSPKAVKIENEEGHPFLAKLV